MAAHSGPTAIYSRPAPTRETTKPGGTDLTPPSTPAEIYNVEEALKILDSSSGSAKLGSSRNKTEDIQPKAEEKGVAYETFPVQVEKPSCLTNEQLVEAEETDPYPWTENSELTEKTSESDSKRSPTLLINPPMESNPERGALECQPKGKPTEILNPSSKGEEQHHLGIHSGSEIEKEQRSKSNSRPKGVNTSLTSRLEEGTSKGSQVDLDLRSNLEDENLDSFKTPDPKSEERKRKNQSLR